jgi:hypothetical protein
MKVKRNFQTPCETCVYAIPKDWSPTIRCGNPDENMQGDGYGINQGQFYYPKNFDPSWRLSECANWELKNEN